MYKILILLFLSSTSFAGIGDLVGGQSKEVKKLLRKSRMIIGDKILFQRDSTFVSAVYSKSLCFDGYEFRAKIRKCTRWSRDGDERRCTKREIIDAVQPKDSFRERCRIMRDDDCEEYQTIDYKQSDIKKVQFLDDSNHSIGEKRVQIPRCN